MTPSLFLAARLQYQEFLIIKYFSSGLRKYRTRRGTFLQLEYSMGGDVGGVGGWIESATGDRRMGTAGGGGLIRIGVGRQSPLPSSVDGGD